MRLADLRSGDRCVVLEHHAEGAFRKRLLEMGFVPGEEVFVVRSAPLKDPIEYNLLGYHVTLRRQEAETIEVRLLDGSREEEKPEDFRDLSNLTMKEGFGEGAGYLKQGTRTIRVAFVGNPNAGKTSLFNVVSGAREHVGNYTGVTVGAKEAVYEQGGYRFELVDLPGTYSLSSYSPEEAFVQNYLFGDRQPDVVLNVVDATNLERHLYLTTQILESGLPIVVALNMWDEFEAEKNRLDLETLSTLIGVPLVPTVAKKGEGKEELFDEIIKIYEHRSESRRLVGVQYPGAVEEAITFTREGVVQVEGKFAPALKKLRPRFVATKLLEGDEAFSKLLTKGSDKGDYLITRAKAATQTFAKKSGLDLQQTILGGRYGFVRGALQETLRSGSEEDREKQHRFDRLLTHKVWGYPIFILIMFLSFQLTFSLGQYPMDWIEAGVAWLGETVSTLMAPGSLRDLIVDGVIAGVGGVLVFLPNIVILYLCIALMEDTGYLSRAAFLMDRIMHGIGLHGKSFIPLLMGFGCNVPAIMATRTIESRNARLMTMLITPFMSCSARLPIYILIAGTFFPDKAGLILFALYLLGIAIAVGSALLMRRFMFKGEDTPFVMELPPYRIPTGISVLLHMWERSKQYLTKMGTTILFASIIIWALGYFPRPAEGVEMTPQEIQEQSYIGRLGKAVEPVFEPMDFDWRMTVALLTGTAAKEVIVSTLGVLYMGDDTDDAGRLGEKLMEARQIDGTAVFDTTNALAFMVFTLLYFPCVASVVAIKKESGGWKWALFQVVYSTAVAWVFAYLVTLLF